MKSKEYVRTVIEDLDSMLVNLTESDIRPDMLLIDKSIVDVLTGVFPIENSPMHYYRGIPTYIQEESDWGSLYNFKAFRNGKLLYRHYTLLG